MLLEQIARLLAEVSPTRTGVQAWDWVVACARTTHTEWGPGSPLEQTLRRLIARLPDHPRVPDARDVFVGAYVVAGGLQRAPLPGMSLAELRAAVVDNPS